MIKTTKRRQAHGGLPARTLSQDREARQGGRNPSAQTKEPGNVPGLRIDSPDSAGPAASPHQKQRRQRERDPEESELAPGERRHHHPAPGPPGGVDVGDAPTGGVAVGVDVGGSVPVGVGVPVEVGVGVRTGRPRTTATALGCPIPVAPPARVLSGATLPFAVLV